MPEPKADVVPATASDLVVSPLAAPPPAAPVPDCCPAPPPLGEVDPSAWLPAAYGQLLIMGLMVAAHCAGMCGPLMLSFRFGMHKAHSGGRMGAALLQLAAYQAGRALWYGLFGALAGGLAGILGNEFSTSLTGGVQLVGPILALFFIVLAIARITGWRGGEGSGAPSGILGQLGRRWQALAGERPVLYAFGLGNLLAFLPCMVTAMVLVLAAGTGSIIHGALVMVLLVVMTTPALAPFALVPAGLPKPSAVWGSRLQTGAIVLTAVWMSLIALAANDVISHVHWHITDDIVVMFF